VESIVSNKTSQSNIELRIKEAGEWLRTSRIDYDAYSNLVRCPWFPFIQRKPSNPQQAIISLQRSVEKLIKAVACASGQYTYEQVLNKGHDSFGLCLEIYRRLTETPLMKLFLDNVQGQIVKQSNARFFSHSESLRQFSELEEKAKPGTARKEMSEWAYELSTLPQEVVSQLVSSQLRCIRAARIGAAILNHMPLGGYSKKGHTSGKLGSRILKALEGRGFLLSDGVKAFFNSEKVSSFFASQPEEKRLMLVKNLGNILLVASVSTAMAILAALTFGHAIFPGYPGNPKERQESIRKLESKSYEEPIGIATSILSVGKLTGSVLKQSVHLITFYAEAFDFMDTDTSGLLQSGAKTS
jgi:hypothetical protein